LAAHGRGPVCDLGHPDPLLEPRQTSRAVRLCRFSPVDCRQSPRREDFVGQPAPSARAPARSCAVRPGNDGVCMKAILRYGRFALLVPLLMWIFASSPALSGPSVTLSPASGHPRSRSMSAAADLPPMKRWTFISTPRSVARFHRRHRSFRKHQLTVPADALPERIGSRRRAQERDSAEAPFTVTTAWRKSVSRRRQTEQSVRERHYHRQRVDLEIA